MALILDSDILIDIQRGHAPAVAWFASLIETPLIPGFVVMELVQDAKDTSQVRSAMRLVAPLRIVWPQSADYADALASFVSLHLSHGLGLIDSLIAATAKGHTASLCTFNVKHYRAVGGLTTVQPYGR